MAQVFDPLPSGNLTSLICCYVNTTSQIQVVRITNIRNWYFERVVFPGQRLMFETLPEGLLEIHTGMMASAILSDTIPCQKLALEPLAVADLASHSPYALAEEREEMRDLVYTAS
jgi:Domain of unknown function (DUF1830)